MLSSVAARRQLPRRNPREADRPAKSAHDNDAPHITAVTRHRLRRHLQASHPDRQHSEASPGGDPPAHTGWVHGPTLPAGSVGAGDDATGAVSSTCIPLVHPALCRRLAHLLLTCPPIASGDVNYCWHNVRWVYHPVVRRTCFLRAAVRVRPCRASIVEFLGSTGLSSSL